MNCKGFATLEVISVLIIISILIFIAVPKISTMFDQVTLDYELKTLATQIELTRSLNRSASIRPEIFSISDCGKVIQLTIRTGKSNYQIQQNAHDSRQSNAAKGEVEVLDHELQDAASDSNHHDDRRNREVSLLLVVNAGVDQSSKAA